MNQVKYVVLDIETTGLDPLTDKTLEVGAIAVGENLHKVSRFSEVVHHNVDLKTVDPYVVDMHTKNDLWGDVEALGWPIQRVDNALRLWLVNLGCEPGTVVLAGHTISFDHGFLKAQFPETATMLSHRTLDFSALARLMRDVGFNIPNHEMPHRAFIDCEIELEEFRAMVDVLRRARLMGLQVAP